MAQTEFEDTDGVFSITDLEDAFPFIRRKGLYYLYYLPGAEEEYVNYRANLYAERWNKDTGEVQPSEHGVENVVVLRGRIVEGPSMEDGAAQGDLHSTTDFLVSAEKVARRPMKSLAAKQMRCFFGGFADDWGLLGKKGISAQIELSKILDEAEETLGATSHKEKMALCTRSGKLSEEHLEMLKRAGWTKTQIEAIKVRKWEEMLGLPHGW